MSMGRCLERVWRRCQAYRSSRTEFLNRSVLEIGHARARWCACPGNARFPDGALGRLWRLMPGSCGITERYPSEHTVSTDSMPRSLLLLALSCGSGIVQCIFAPVAHDVAGPPQLDKASMLPRVSSVDFGTDSAFRPIRPAHSYPLPPELVSVQTRDRNADSARRYRVGA